MTKKQNEISATLSQAEIELQSIAAIKSKLDTQLQTMQSTMITSLSVAKQNAENFLHNEKEKINKHFTQKVLDVKQNAKALVIKAESEIIKELVLISLKVVKTELQDKTDFDATKLVNALVF